MRKGWFEEAGSPHGGQLGREGVLAWGGVVVMLG
jgi:hypothetical protein